MNSIYTTGSAKRKQMIGKETELMFPDAKVFSDEERVSGKAQGADWYFAKIGDKRFNVSDQIADARYDYQVEINSNVELSNAQIAAVENVVESIIVLKGDKVVDATKAIEKILKKEYKISCSVNITYLEKTLSGTFEVECVGFDRPITVRLENVESDKIVNVRNENEVAL